MDGGKMKIEEALQKYRGYRQTLVDQTRQLTAQRDAAQQRAKLTGAAEDAELAATLQLSIQETREKFNANQEVLDKLVEQQCLLTNAEVAKQQGEAMSDYATEIGKIMEVARRIASGARVPYQDEKKLMEYDGELYQAVKAAAMLNRIQEKKRKEYDSLWDDEEKKREESTDPMELAADAEVPGEIALPDIPVDTAAAETVAE